MIDDIIKECTGFDWDDGNASKNWIKHKVMTSEAERVFFNSPLFLMNDIKHSAQEKRWFAFGNTDDNRFLTISFTIRNQKIRVVMARDMSKKERKWYNEQ